MKPIYRVIILISLILVSCKSQDLSIMTYNIRLDLESDGENAWPNRKVMVGSQILLLEPDILGVQEARPNQVEYLAEKLKHYSKIGKGRDGGNKGEYSAIYFNTATTKILQYDTFWLSETPEQVSKGWDAAYPRICSYGLFTTLKCNKRFWVFNTHLDHVGEKARLNGIELILDRIKELNTKGYPVFLIGDFNVEPNSELIQMLSEIMVDAKTLAEVDFGSTGTFNGFETDQPAEKRIDYIMVSDPEAIEVKKYGVFSSLIDQRYPSDHFPVFVYFKL